MTSPYIEEALASTRTEAEVRAEKARTANQLFRAIVGNANEPMHDPDMNISEPRGLL